MDKVWIETQDAFAAIVAEWEALRDADPFATVFLSAPWLTAFFAMSPAPWSILTLRRDGSLVAALPISMRGAPHHLLPVARELTFASAPFADYQGMLCRTDDEDAVIDAFAETLMAMPWQRADLCDVRDPRVGSLARRLASSGALLHELPLEPCSSIELPADWATYLASLSKPTRRATLRPTKLMAEELPAARTSVSADGDAEAHVEAVLHLNALRWGTNPSRYTRYHRLLLEAHARGCLRITAVWDGDRPIAAGAAFVDAARGFYGSYLIGFDPQYARFSPGKALIALGIQDAIAGGYRTYDFMRGGEAYKSSYATGETTNAHYALRRHGARAVLLGAIEPGYAALRRALTRIRSRRAA